MEFMDADAAPSASEHSDEEEDDTEDPALVVVVGSGRSGDVRRGIRSSHDGRKREGLQA